MPDFTKITSYEELMLNKKQMIEIGSGAFGVVFKFIGKDNELCAVKQIRIPNDKQKQQRIQQLEKEKEFLCTYHQKNIVKGYFGFTQQTDNNLYYYLGMEFVGDNLNSKIERVINKTDSFTDEIIFNYALQLCNALYFLQIKNVAHQDLKPQNILIDKDNTLKICDFSEFRTNTDAYKSMLATQIGTRAYMAPEHFRKNKKIIPIKADVYSYGVTILQCFLRCTSASIDCLNEKDGEEALNYLVSQFNEEMQYFFQKCTCHNLIERFDFLDIKIFLQAKLDKLSFQDKSEIKQLKNEITSLKQKNIEITNNYKNLTNVVTNLQNENQNLQKLQKSIQNENENLQRFKKSIQNENQNLQKQQKVLQNDFKKLTDLVSQLQQQKQTKPSNDQTYQQVQVSSPKKNKRKCDNCSKEFDFDKEQEVNYKGFCENCQSSETKTKTYPIAYPKPNRVTFTSKITYTKPDPKPNLIFRDTTIYQKPNPKPSPIAFIQKKLNPTKTTTYPLIFKDTKPIIFKNNIVNKQPTVYPKPYPIAYPKPNRALISYSKAKKEEDSD